MYLQLYQHEGQGSGGICDQLLCTHIYIHTHVAVTTNSIHISVMLYTVNEGVYICTINIHTPIFSTAHTYLYQLSLGNFGDGEDCD